MCIFQNNSSGELIRDQSISISFLLAMINLELFSNNLFSSILNVASRYVLNHPLSHFRWLSPFVKYEVIYCNSNIHNTEKNETAAFKLFKLNYVYFIKIRQDGSCHTEVKTSINEGWKVISLLIWVLRNSNVLPKTKRLIYTSIVQSIMLYGSETWTWEQAQKKRLLSNGFLAKVSQTIKTGKS